MKPVLIIPSFNPADYQIDPDDLKSAIDRSNQNIELTPKEKQILKKTEQAAIQHYGKLYIQRVPKKDYINYSGRQTKILHGQASRYGLLELGKPVINFEVLIREFHDFLAKFGKQLNTLVDGNNPMTGPESSALERWRKIKADREELKLEIDRDNLVPKEAVWEVMLAIANELKRLQFELHKNNQSETAYRIEETCEEIMDELNKEVRTHNGTDESDNSTVDS